ncbi:MAG: hypothetical protein ABL912_01800 [Novosphingobium sp.]
MSLVDLLADQGAELSRLTDEAADRVLSALEDARRIVLERMTAIQVNPENTARLRVLLLQLETGIAELRSRVGDALSTGESEAHRAVVAHLLGLVRNEDPDLAPNIQPAILERLSRRSDLLLHRYSSDRYSAQVMDAAQRELVAGVAANLPQAQIAERIAGATGSVIAGHRGRAELIARMELSRAYNDAYLDSLYELDAEDPQPENPLHKRIEEYIDARNHPFSRVADQQTVPIGDLFAVSVADVESMARSMGVPSRGVLWERAGGEYFGSNLPAHYNDRGRIVAWRPSWG